MGMYSNLDALKYVTSIPFSLNHPSSSSLKGVDLNAQINLEKSILIMEEQKQPSQQELVQAYQMLEAERQDTV